MTTNNPHFRRRFTYSNVMATVAIFLAMGGAGAVAATHLGRNTVGSTQLKAAAVTGAKVKDGSLTGADVNGSTLGKVPTASRADSASSADHAAGAHRADSAGHADAATRADTAGHADTAAQASTAVTGESAATAKLAETAAALTEPEAPHIFNRPGENKSAAIFTVITNVGFYRDHEGVVHLQGRAEPNAGGSGFFAELPVGYRPSQDEVFFGVGPKPTALVTVEAGGSINIINADKGETVSLDGITWRAVS